MPIDNSIDSGRHGHRIIKDVTNVNGVPFEIDKQRLWQSQALMARIDITPHGLERCTVA